MVPSRVIDALNRDGAGGIEPHAKDRGGCGKLCGVGAKVSGLREACGSTHGESIHLHGTAQHAVCVLHGVSEANLHGALLLSIFTISHAGASRATYSRAVQLCPSNVPTPLCAGPRRAAAVCGGGHCQDHNSRQVGDLMVDRAAV